MGGTAERKNGDIWLEHERSSGSLSLGSFKTSRIPAHGKIFFLKISNARDFPNFFEVVMVGTEDECEDFVATITVVDKDLKDFASMSSHPRPLDEQAWGKMGLTLPKKDFLKIKLPGVLSDHSEINLYSFRMKVTICKI